MAAAHCALLLRPVEMFPWVKAYMKYIEVNHPAHYAQRSRRFGGAFDRPMELSAKLALARGCGEMMVKDWHGDLVRGEEIITGMIQQCHNLWGFGEAMWDYVRVRMTSAELQSARRQLDECMAEKTRVEIEPDSRSPSEQVMMHASLLGRPSTLAIVSLPRALRFPCTLPCALPGSFPLLFSPAMMSYTDAQRSLQIIYARHAMLDVYDWHACMRARRQTRVH